MREENKLKKIWPLNSKDPQNYSSNERVKTLPMYSFYKNTLTFNCCFSNLSLLDLSWEDVPAGRARTTACVQPKDPKTGGGSLSTPDFTSSSLTLSSTEDLSDSVWGLLLI